MESMGHFHRTRSQALAFAKMASAPKKTKADIAEHVFSKNTFNVLSSCCPFEKTCSAMSALVLFGADAILANAKAWDLVL